MVEHQCGTGGIGEYEAVPHTVDPAGVVHVRTQAADVKLYGLRPHRAPKFDSARSAALVRLAFERRTVEPHLGMGFAIVSDVPVVMKHVKQDTIFTPIKGIDLKQKIVREAYLDGAYIIDRRCISNKVFLQSFISNVMRYRRIATIEELQQRYLPQDFLASGNAVAVETPMIGSRTQAWQQASGTAVAISSSRRHTQDC